MNNDLIQTNKQKLLDEQKKLLRLLKRDTNPDGKGEFPGDFKPTWEERGSEESESAQEVEAYASNLGVTFDLEKRLKKVNGALERIENGTYGKCKFGDDIEKPRLAAEPAAEVCMKHAGS